MATQNVGSTATQVMILKSMESFVAARHRLFDDPVCVQFLPAPARFIVSRKLLRAVLATLVERRMPGGYGGMVCRTRYIDDAVLAAVSAGITNVVIVGAGLDTRAYRMNALAAVQVFELDLPTMVEHKQRRVTRLFGSLPRHVTYVPIDFDAEGVSEALERAGLDRRARAFFILEGITQYISEGAVDSVLQSVSQAARGSEVVFTYVLKEVIAGRSTRFGSGAGVRNFARRFEWLSGFDPLRLPEHLRGLGLELIEDVGASDYQTRYLAPLQRDLSVFEIERIARARLN